MPQILFKRGNTAQNDGYTGLLGSITIDTQTRRMRVHDGVTAGGHEVAKIQDVNDLISQISGLEISDIDGLQAALDALQNNKVETSALGVTVATLDGSGKVPMSQINDAVLGQVEYMGTWNADTNTPTLPATPAKKGDYYVTSVAGTFNTVDFEVGDWIISNGDAWEKVDNTDAVSSVAGKVGHVTLNKGDVGLANVDNTSDADKPVSSAQQEALNLKANLASPALTGTPTAPTPDNSDSSTRIATTAFVVNKIAAVSSGVVTVNGRSGEVTLTAADVGLDNVENYGVANQAEAQAATSNVKYMTPLRTKELVEAANYTIDFGTLD